MIIFEPSLENHQFSQPRYIYLIHGNALYLFSILKIKTAKCKEHVTTAVFYFFLLNLRYTKIFNLVKWPCMGFC